MQIHVHVHILVISSLSYFFTFDTDYWLLIQVNLKHNELNTQIRKNLLILEG